MSVITVERKILEKNDSIAAVLRSEFSEKEIYVINILSSPGSGKTSLIEKIVLRLKNNIKMSVIIGDVQTDNDAKRIGLLGIPAVQIITNGACHLEANLVREAWSQMKDDMEFLIIENVGNLVCPSGFDLGENIKVVLLSTTEGDDKPLKYPAVFKNSSVLVINKVDLLPYINCSVDLMRTNALKINPHLKIFETSCTTGKGVVELCDWLIDNIRK